MQQYIFSVNSEFPLKYVVVILLLYCNIMISMLYCITFETILFQWGFIFLMMETTMDENSLFIHPKWSNIIPTEDL